MAIANDREFIVAYLLSELVLGLEWGWVSDFRWGWSLSWSPQVKAKAGAVAVARAGAFKRKPLTHNYTL